MSISTCALREEGDPAIIKITASHSGFLSTPSARRATVSFCWFPKTANYFYPHPPRGGRHKTTVPCLGRVIFLSTPSARRATDRQKHSSRTFTISIHALREEGDGMCWGFPRRRPKFLSTPSARRATISGAEHRAHGTDFYPRPPRGGRPDPNAPPG